MDIHLFEHNQKAYDAAVSMMEEEGRAAVIHPTGTGKSFIAFKLAADHPDAKICWLSPSEYIYRTQLENLKTTLKDGEKARAGTLSDRGAACLGNIRFLTYSRLMRNEEDMKELCPDYIILDEFHRCGAVEWGRSVEKLLAMYPAAKLLGLSATNIRYLDNRRDMAQEIFRGRIASEMTLGEAITRGILPAPKYVIALYSHGLKPYGRNSHEQEPDGRKPYKQESSGQKLNEQKSDGQKPYEQESCGRKPYKRNSWEAELERLEQRARSSAEEGIDHRSLQLLEQLKRTLEQAEGLDRIFWKHMGKAHGKYILFCADKEHMDEMKEHVGEWFHLIDRSPHIYTAYYDNPETHRDFAAFKEDDSEHLKLLFCIDMLNEGVHVEDVDGVILLRPTVSPIIYLQQIGRALSAGTSEGPVIFDLVNNFEGLCCIDCLEQEIEEAFTLMPYSHGGQKKYDGRFQVIDEVRDYRELFRQLQASLSSTWDTCYLAAQAYYREKGNLRIPKDHMTSTGLALGSWIRTQRKVYAGKAAGALTEEKIQKLDAIGMIWDVRKSSWEEGYGELLAYHKKYGNVDVKARYLSDSGFALGKWVSNLRVNIRKKGVDRVLSGEQLEKLEALGMIWDKNSERWETYLRAAREYRERHGDLKVPARYVTEEGIPLGNWLHAIRHGISGEGSGVTALTEEQRRQLSDLGMEWEKDSIRLWNMKFELARKYFEEHGNLDIPVAYCVGDVRLGRWISNIRVKRRNPKSSGIVLDESRIRQLDSIGMNWK